MPKRSRYEYVTVDNNGIRVYASGTNHIFDSITTWDAYEAHWHVNPEDIQYNIYFVGIGYNMVLTCKDESEYDSIVDELTEQGIGKRI
jgi:hypothetical protein